MNCGWVGAACARPGLRGLCARAPSLMSVHDPRSLQARDLMSDDVVPRGEALNRAGVSLTACRSSGMADSLESKMDDISIPCGKRSYVRCRGFLSIECGEVGRERQPTCLGARINKRLPAHPDELSRGAPHLGCLTARACLGRAAQEHLESEHEHPEGETSSCALRDSRPDRAPGRVGQSVRRPSRAISRSSDPGRARRTGTGRP